MITRKKSSQQEIEETSDMEKQDLPLYLTIDYETFSFETTKLNIVDRMCTDCNKENSGKEVSSKKDIMIMIKQISKCCSLKDGYISIHTSMNEGVVREVLAASNKPINSEKISSSLRNRWALTPFPKNVNKIVIEKLAKANKWIATSINEA